MSPVKERRVDPLLIPRAAQVVSYAAGELRGIAQDLHPSMGVGRYRGERGRSERVIHLQIGERKVVVETLVLLCKLLTIADVHGRLGGRVGVCEDVVKIDSRVTAGHQALEDQAWSDVQGVVRMKQQ